MTDKQVKFGKIFMLVIGIILLFAGIFILIVGRNNFTDTLINNGHFFISGGILIFLGLSWRKNKD